MIVQLCQGARSAARGALPGSQRCRLPSPLLYLNQLHTGSFVLQASPAESEENGECVTLACV